jgi:alkyldihydroxyacetonephosphate synthase
VVRPAGEDQIAAVVRAALEQDAVVIPFGGGSSISGSLAAEPGEKRPVISIDMSRLSRVLSVDATSQLARVQAGVFGPDLERQLGAQDWTCGHFPDSFTYSTLGGWIATRSSGMQSDLYGDIAELTRGLRMVTPSAQERSCPQRFPWRPSYWSVRRWRASVAAACCSAATVLGTSRRALSSAKSWIAPL